MAWGIVDGIFVLRDKLPCVTAIEGRVKGDMTIRSYAQALLCKTPCLKKVPPEPYAKARESFYRLLLAGHLWVPFVLTCAR
jgi:hypothetical protein